MDWSIKRTFWGDRIVDAQDQVVGSTRRGLFSTRVLNASGTLLWCIRTRPLFGGGITVNQQKLDVQYKNEGNYFLPRKLEQVAAEVDGVRYQMRRNRENQFQIFKDSVSLGNSTGTWNPAKRWTTDNALPDSVAMLFFELARQIQLVEAADIY